MDILKEVFSIILIIVVLDCIFEWLSLPYKINKTNEKLDKIIGLLKMR